MALKLAELFAEYEKGRNPLTYIPLAEELRKRKEYAKALEICRTGLAKFGLSARGQTVLGKILVDMERNDEAISALRKAVDLAPNGYEPSLWLAKALIRRLEYFEAKEVLAPLLATYRSDPELAQMLRIIDAELRKTRPVEIPKSSRTGAQRIPGHTGPQRMPTAPQRLATGPYRSASSSGGGFGHLIPPAAASLREELEAIEGVDVVLDFGLRENRGDLFFIDVPGQELDDDIKTTVVDTWRLCTKLGFAKPRQLIFEGLRGKIFLRVHGERGLVAVTEASVKLGRLLLMMQQYLQARS